MPNLYNWESRTITCIDLDRALGKLDDFHFSLLVARNVLGLTWDETSEITGWGVDKCQREFRDCSWALALWLRSYYGHGHTEWVRQCQPSLYP
jgi:hypothetical protein